MRDYRKEFDRRVEWLGKRLEETGAKGFVYGNSGGKDCTLVGILCRAASENTLGVIMPCESKRNYGEDRQHALLVAEKFGIETVEIDLSAVKKAFSQAVGAVSEPSDIAKANINPRLRMTALYCVAQTRGALVVGTGNKSELTMGYFTKWGDGASDVNPIADLTVTEIFEFLRYLGAPDVIINKAPSAGLWEGQTDEQEMGVTYAEVDAFIRGESLPKEVGRRISSANDRSAHKRRMPVFYPEGSPAEVLCGAAEKPSPDENRD